MQRNLKVRHVGFAASEITKNGGVTICVPVAPDTTAGRAVQEVIEQHGELIELHVSTTLDVCESRDRKGRTPRRAEARYRS